MPSLPRAPGLLRLSRSQQWSGLRFRINPAIVARHRQPIHTGLVNFKLDPPSPSDISKCVGVDLDKVVGSPGWRIDDLLPPKRTSSESTADDSITPATLRHLLHLSGLPPPQTPQEESNLLSALHDQVHFVRRVQSVQTENIDPLVRIGHESDPEIDPAAVLSYQECVDESELEEIPGLEWRAWDVCDLKGGSSEGREDGWFTVNDVRTNREKEDVDK